MGHQPGSPKLRNQKLKKIPSCNQLAEQFLQLERLRQKVRTVESAHVGPAAHASRKMTVSSAKREL